MKNNFDTVSELPKNNGGVLVPTVTDEQGRGYDIFSLLLKERTIVVQGQVEAGMAGVIIAQLKYLEALDKNAPIQMIINSPGGSIVDGLGIYDVMRQVNCPITTIGVGMQASMGSVLLAGGDHRVMAPNARLLVHQGSGRAEGTPSDLEISRAFHQTMVDRLKTVYQDHTGLSRKYWGIVLNRDTWFTAEQAKKIGFIHEIVEIKPTKKAPYAQDRALVDAFSKAKEDVAAKYKTAEEIIKVINSDDIDENTPELGRVRPELATALAQFPEFWTATRKAEHEQALKAAATSNDNAKATATLKHTAPGLK